MTRSERDRGQVLVLFALVLIGLLGMAALAIDVTSVYAQQRHERSVADAAALAGASDMFAQGTTAVGATEWTNGRTHAMRNLVNEFLGPTAALPTCPSAGGGTVVPSPTYGADIVNCALAGTPYYVSVFAPAPSCATGACDVNRSVQVTVRHPNYPLSFAGLFGQSRWNVPVTSVAERSLGSNYVFVTLRPPNPSRSASGACAPDCDANENDILLDGTNTKLTVTNGDMGTNTNMTLKSGSTVSLGSGAFVDRYDAYQNWAAPPPGRQLSAPVNDPHYPVPAAPSTNPTDPRAKIYTTNAAGHLSATACAAEVTSHVPATYQNVNLSAAGATAGTVVCYAPGEYEDHQKVGNELTGAVTAMVFTPGVYFFDAGLQPGNNVIVVGGYQPASSASPPSPTGVAFVFPISCSPDCSFAGNSADLIALNAGTSYTGNPTNPTGSGTPAAAAVNWDGSRVQTTTKIPQPMTVIVRPDPACVVGTIDTCPHENQNTQLKLPGSGSLLLFGVQYAPTDNVTISGGSGSNGYLGQIWAWTVQYTGGSNINLAGLGDPKPGVLRIATPCSPRTPCTNPEASAVLP
jgi:hypothetical protein